MGVLNKYAMFVGVNGYGNVNDGGTCIYIKCSIGVYSRFKYHLDC